MTYLIAFAVAYLIGSVSSAVLVCRLFQLPDPRQHGSHNPGATNVLRIGGKIPAACTLLGDALKGLLPVLVAKSMSDDPLLISGVLLAAIAGHLLPVFFQFKGGKGVATALGGLIALSPLLGFAFVATWGLVFALSRYSSLSALVAISSMPVWALGFLNAQYAVALLFLALIIIARHHENIKRLLKGAEDKR